MSYGSRKFLLTLLVIAIGVAMTFLNLLTPALVELLKWVSGLYMGFNVSQKAAEWVSTKITAAKETGS